MPAMTDFFTDIYALEITTGNAFFRLVVSVILGTAIGYERKKKGQVAGVRTFSLIAMGACLAMLLSIYVPQEYLGLKNGDPARIAAQVITGIGFLGGGAMIHLKGSIRGLTTAAGIWVTAIMGLAVGVGMYMEAICTTVLCLIILTGYDRYEQWRRLGQESRVIHIKAPRIITDIEPLRKVLSDNGLHLSTFYVDYDYQRSETGINLIILTPPQTDMLAVISRMHDVVDAHEITLTSEPNI